MYEFQGERGQGIGQALFGGVPFALALARESGRELKLRVSAGRRPLEYYLGDRTGWSRDVPPSGAGPVFEFWNFASTDAVETIEDAVHSDLTSVTIRGNSLRAQDHATRIGYFRELFDLATPSEFQPDAVVHLRTGDVHAFGMGRFGHRDIREVVWKSGGVEAAAGCALRLALATVRERDQRPDPLIMFLSDSAAARRWAIRQDMGCRIVTTSLSVGHSYRGNDDVFRQLWTDLAYMIEAPVLIYSGGAFSQLAAITNRGRCIPLEPHIPDPRPRPLSEVRWQRLVARLRQITRW